MQNFQLQKNIFLLVNILEKQCMCYIYISNDELNYRYVLV